MAYVRTVKTASGATAVQIVHSSRRGSREIEHLGSAHDDAGAGGAEGGRAAAAGRRVRPSSTSGWTPVGGGRGRCRSSSSRMGASVGRVGRGLRRARVRRGRRRRRGVPASWCWRGSSSRPASWTRCGCSTRSGSRRRRIATVNAAAAGLRQAVVAAGAGGGVRGARRCWARRRWCSTTCRTLYFETDAGDGFREPGFSKERRLEPQITDRAAHRRVRVPADGPGVRGQQGRDHDDAAGDQRVHGRPPAHRRHRGRRRRDDLRGQPEGDRGRRAVVHPRRPDPRRPLRGRRSGAATTPASRSPTGTSSPSPGRPRHASEPAASRPGHLLPVPRRPGPPHAARDRRAGRQSREGRRRARRRSSGTGSSSSPAAPRRSTGTWRPRPAPWPG